MSLISKHVSVLIINFMNFDHNEKNDIYFSFILYTGFPEKQHVVGSKHLTLNTVYLLALILSVVVKRSMAG